MPTFEYIPFPLNCSEPFTPRPTLRPTFSKSFNSLPWRTASRSSLESAPPLAACLLARCATGSSPPSKLSTTDEDFLHVQAPEKPKTHKCSICELEFEIGQVHGHHPTTHGKAEERPSLEQSIVCEKRERLLDLSLTQVWCQCLVFLTWGKFLCSVLLPTFDRAPLIHSWLSPYADIPLMI
ncbi:hypothetical protein RHMOL_Rhmol09G0122400 [Rhododendron molle]|uniref:Uncharacterized protein n=1 Tax=Rhododendron molle TaxID=49168 RepID=A0ACC0MCU3_RHOML|nr:hypothetical protein RHMOL_Rhmol09G0122400 [Rhododendron molle]